MSPAQHSSLPLQGLDVYLSVLGRFAPFAASSGQRRGGLVARPFARRLLVERPGPPMMTLFVLLMDPRAVAPGTTSNSLRRWQTQRGRQHLTALLRLRPEPPTDQTSIDYQRMAIHEARLVTRQPQRGACDVLGESSSLDGL